MSTGKNMHNILKCTCIIVAFDYMHLFIFIIVIPKLCLEQLGVACDLEFRLKIRVTTMGWQARDQVQSVAVFY